MGMTTTGTEQLQQRLGRLTGAEGKTVLRKGCRAGAKVLASAIQKALPGRRKKRVKVRALKRSRTRVGVRVVVDDRNAKGEPFRQFGEYGTKHEQAKDWQHKAVRGSGTQALDKATETMAAGIERLATA